MKLNIERTVSISHRLANFKYWKRNFKKLRLHWKAVKLVNAVDLMACCWKSLQPGPFSFQKQILVMYCATGWLNQRYKKQRRMIFQRSEIFEFFLCVFATMKTVFQWTSWTLVEAQRIKASNWKAQNITFLLTLLWVTAYTRCVAGSWRFLPPVGLSLTPLILVLLARPFIGVITLQHSVVCLLCKLAGVNSCYLPDPFKVLCFSMCCCTDSDPTISLIL